MNKITTEFYNIYFSNNENFDFYLKKYSKIFLLTDNIIYENCFNLFLERFNINRDNLNIIIIETGEKNKNLTTCVKIWEELTKNEADRNSLLINLCGGVISDMGGFCASVFKRGISCINIPTTLLSQVDASVGAKTGIDFEGLKNNLGTFSNPIAVYIYPEFIKTLDKKNLISGYAEMLKHALLKGDNFFEELEKIDFNNLETLEKLIFKSVEIKKEVVEKDPYEKNVRKTLNFGHTIGHGIESYFLLNRKEEMLHGEAVAIGLICELYLSKITKNFSNELLSKISKFIISIYGFYKITEPEINEIIKFMKNDKKNSNNKINFVLLESLGIPIIDNFIEEKYIEDSIKFYISSSYT